jgi:HK97 gp10 family phage protein
VTDAVTVKLTGLDGVLDMLSKLPPEVVSKRGGPVLRALRKGARVIVAQAKTNFRSAVQQAGKTGITDSTGFTEKQITTRRRQPPGGVRGEKVVVTVRSVPHPSGHVFRNRPIRSNDIAFIMEAGTAKQPPTPWLRPAFAAKAEQAITTTETALVQDLDRIVRKLGRAGGIG